MKITTRPYSPALLLLFAMQTGVVEAQPAKRFSIDSSGDFSQGTSFGTIVRERGSLVRGKQSKRSDIEGATIAYSHIQGNDGTVFIGTDNEGSIYRVSSKGNGQAKKFATTKEALVTALSFGPSSKLLAATSPNGKIFEISADGKTKIFAELKGANHVWDLYYNKSSSTLFAATGPEGKIFAVRKGANPKVVYDDPSAPHIMSLAPSGDGKILAGTGGAARLLELSTRKADKARVIWDFAGNEISDIDQKDGTIAVVVNEFPKAPLGQEPAKKSSSLSARKPKGLKVPLPKKGKGALWVLKKGQGPERILHGKSTHFTSVEVGSKGTVYVATGQDGKLVRILKDRSHDILFDVDERQVLGFSVGTPKPYFVTGDGAALYQISDKASQSKRKGRGFYWESKVLDAKFLSKWGGLRYRAKGKPLFETRSGNTKVPDDTWSAWAKPSKVGFQVRSPSARFLQIRSALIGSKDELFAILAYYRPMNQRPVVHSLKIKNNGSIAGSTSKGAKKGGVNKPSSDYQISWKVRNPDNDAIRFRLFFRHEAHKRWRPLLKSDEVLEKTDYKWQTDALPDGVYVLRVVASDEGVQSQALRSEAFSEPMIVDNHAPIFGQLSVKGNKVRGEVRDLVGPIVKLEHALNGGNWKPLEATDGIFDSKRESFSVQIPERTKLVKNGDAAKGSNTTNEDIVAIRAFDARGHSSVAELVIQ